MLLVILFVFACQKQGNENTETSLVVEQNRNVSPNNALNPLQTNPNEINTENLENVSKIYLGCYSAGNRGATVMYISPEYIQTSNGKQQKIPYILISADKNKKIYLLKLVQKDKSNFLQGYESITFINDDEILLEDYESEEDFKKGNRSGFLRFAKDECKTVLSFLE
jgi:hypothetical protein